MLLMEQCIVLCENATLYRHTTCWSLYICNNGTSSMEQLCQRLVWMRHIPTSIPLTGPYSNTAVTAITFSPNGAFGGGFVVDTTHTGNEIVINNTLVSRGDTDPTSLTVTLAVFDESSNTTDTSLFSLPVPPNGVPRIQAILQKVFSFKVSLSTSTTANLSWDISGDTTETIDSFISSSTSLVLGQKILLPSHRQEELILVLPSLLLVVKFIRGISILRITKKSVA